MKTLHSISLLTTLLITLSCCKKDKPDCGCNAETIDHYKDQLGSLSYDPNKQQYFIYTIAADQPRQNFICDTTVANFHQLLGEGPALTKVKFSAEIKKLCIPDTVYYWTEPKAILIHHIESN